MRHSSAASELINCYLCTQINARGLWCQPLLSNQAGKTLQFFFMIKTFKRTEHGRDFVFRCVRFLWGTAHFCPFWGFFKSFFSWPAPDSLRGCQSNLVIQRKPHFSFSFSHFLYPPKEKAVFWGVASALQYWYMAVPPRHGMRTGKALQTRGIQANRYC